MAADVLTKPLGRNTHLRMVRLLGLTSASSAVGVLE
jgi:hypothetical protein